MDKSVQDKAKQEGRLPETPEEKPIDLSGMKSLNAEKAFGWFKKSAGAICYGEYVGRFEKTWEKNDKDDEDSGAKYYHQIRLWNPTTAAVPTDTGSVEKIAPPGSILNVDESKALEAMRDLPNQNKGKHVVYIKYLDKVKIKGTAQTFWPAEVKVRDMKSGESPF